MNWLEGWWGRLPGSAVARLALVLNGVILALVVAVVAIDVLGQRNYQLEVARQEAQSLVTEQARQITDQIQGYEYALGQLETRLNVARTLQGADASSVQDLLRQFQQLIPDSFDLLLLQSGGQMMAASTIVSGPQSLASYCLPLQEFLGQGHRGGLNVFQGSYAGRCPPEGTLIYARPLRKVGEGGAGETVWLLLHDGAFERVFTQRLPRLDVGWNYRIRGGPTDALLATGHSGSVDTVDAWLDDGRRVIDISERLAGTPVRLMLTLDAAELLRRHWWPYALRVSAMGAAFVLLWVLFSIFGVRLVQRHQRQLQASEARFDRSLDYAGVGAWEWDIGSGELHWTRRCWPMFGYASPLQDLRYENFIRRIHDDDRIRVEQALQDCVQHNIPYDVDYRVVWPDGSVRSLRSSGNVQRTADGQPLSMFGVLQDLTHEAELTRELQAILDNVIDAIITIDQQGVITSFNRAATHIFGYQPGEAIGGKVNMLMPEPYSSEHDGYMARYQTTGECRIIGLGRELQGRHKTGRVFPIHLAVSAVEHEGKPMYVGVIRDITESRRAQEEIQRLAYSDQLTGLPNRRLLLDRLTRTLALGQRHMHHGALIFIDIDHFKELNDARGHEVGDQLLCEVAQRLVPAVRECDTVTRLGGDEFVILLDDLGSNAALAALHAETVVHKLMQVLQQPFELKGRAHATSASLGIAIFGPDSSPATVLMAQADMAMYQAKREGRNAYRFFDETLQKNQQARAALEQEMRLGLQDDSFFLVYQPQLDAQGRLLGLEALVRWNHPRRGLVPPGQFIALAEQSGLIIELGQVVLRQACRQLAAWDQVPALAGIGVSVNVSAGQFRDKDFVRQVIDALQAARVEPNRLKLELTESALVDDVDNLARNMQFLKGLGVGFALDDFGTGYSSLSYLKRLPIDQLKIDRSFVIDLPHDANSAAIARTVVALGQTLGMAVIAEGVETEEQASALRECGCHAFQGYLYSRPLTVTQLHDFIAARTVSEHT